MNMSTAFKSETGWRKSVLQLYEEDKKVLVDVRRTDDMDHGSGTGMLKYHHRCLPGFPTGGTPWYERSRSADSARTRETRGRGGDVFLRRRKSGGAKSIWHSTAAEPHGRVPHVRPRTISGGAVGCPFGPLVAISMQVNFQSCIFAMYTTG